MLDLSKWMSGLGPNNWWKIRVILPYSERFYIPACYHDIGYDEWISEEDKSKVDQKFYFDMLCECENKIQNKIAYFYYYMVKCYWYLYFNYKK